MATKAEERAARQPKIEKKLKEQAAEKARKKTLRDAKKAEKATERAAQGNKTSARFVNAAKARLADAKQTAAKAGEIPAKAAKTIRDLGGKVKKETTTRVGQLKDRVKGIVKSPEGTGRTGGLRGRPSATAPTSKGANKALDAAEKLAKRNAKLLAGGAKVIGGGLGVGLLAHDAATTDNAELRGASGINPVDPLVGAQPGGQAPGAQAPTSLRRPQDALLEGLRAPIGLVRRFFGAGDDEAGARELAARGSGQPTPAAGLRGTTPGGAPAPIFEEGLQQTVNTGVADPAPVGVRKFNNADATAAAAGIDPPSRRGAASLEENQAVIDRLITRNQGLRAAQLSQSQAAPGIGRQAEGTPAATQAANQAAGGGIASAFGSLALSGNQLRRQAAERGREFSAQQTEADSRNTIQNTLAAQSSRFEALDQASKNRVTDDIQGFVTTLADLENPADKERFLDSTFSQAIQNPDATGAQIFAQQEAANEIRTLVGRGFFDAFKFSTERGLIDWVMSLGQGGQSEPLLLADGRSFMTINPSTGMLEIVSQDGSTRQVLDNPQDLSPRVQELLKSMAPQASGNTVGPPQGHPANLRDLQLRQ